MATLKSAQIEQVPTIEKLTLDDAPLAVHEEEPDCDRGRTLYERLMHPIEGNTLSSYITTYLTQVAHASELLLYLSKPGNLDSQDWSALFEAPDSPDEARQQGWDLNPAETDQIIRTLRAAAEECGAQLGTLYNPLEQRQNPLMHTGSNKLPDRNDDDTDAQWTAQGLRLLARIPPAGPADISELRVCVAGNVDSGKSTLTAVLAKGKLDDGRGRARMALFRHKHEQESGRTSSVGLEILGFDATSHDVNGGGGDELDSASRKQQLSWDQISNKSSKIVSFIDLAGHEKYLKTTLFGLTSSTPDFVMLVIGSNAGLIGMCKEHLSVALALNVPVICVITKTDMTPANIQAQTRKQLVKILRSPGCRKTPVYVRDSGMAIELARSFSTSGARIAPIFETSNLTGEGLAQLKTFLNTVPTSEQSDRYDPDAPFEFSISDVFSVPFVGSVVSGIISSGRIAVGDAVMLGPDGLGQYIPTGVKSIQRKRVNVNHATAGQSVSFALKRVKRANLRKGMILVKAAPAAVPPKPVWKFQASILVLYHNTTIQKKYQSMCHVAAIRQTVRILDIHDKTVLRTGDRATVTMEFITRPEQVKVGQKMLFREGKCKGLGIITSVS